MAWYVATSLKIQAAPGVDPTKFVNRQIYGSSSGARTAITNVISYFGAPFVGINVIDESGTDVDDRSSEPVLDDTPDNTVLQVYELFYGTAVGVFVDGDVIVDSLTNQIIGTILTEGVTTYDGVYTDFDGHVDNTKRLEDGFFYQDFSYVIRSPISLNVYQQVAFDVLHPAGTKLFAQFIDFQNYPLPPLGLFAPDITIEDVSTYVFPVLTYFNDGATLGALPLPPIIDVTVDAFPVLTYASNIHRFVPSTDVIGVATGSMAPFANMPISAIQNWKGTNFTDCTGVYGVGATHFTTYLINTLMSGASKTENQPVLPSCFGHFERSSYRLSST